MMCSAERQSLQPRDSNTQNGRSAAAKGLGVLTLDYEVRTPPAIHLGNLGMRPALGDVRKAGEIDRFHLVVHVGLKNEIVPVFPRWSVLHVALVVVEARRGNESAPKLRQPVGQLRVHHDVWRREDHMFHAAVD